MMKKLERKSKRRRERLALSLPVRVKGLEADGEAWEELTQLIDVTPFGARFTLARLAERGRLLHLTFPMPPKLRCYDYLDEQYQVWALVRNIGAIEDRTEGLRFLAGVAFIGKELPRSYAQNPGQQYDVTLLRPDAMWVLREYTPQTGPTDRSGVTRLSMAVAVTLQVLDERGSVVAQEETVTENISRRGAAVFTGFNLERDSLVIVRSSQHQLSVLAAVRACRTGVDRVKRLHLEFMGGMWPLEGVE